MRMSSTQTFDLSKKNVNNYSRSKPAIKSAIIVIGSELINGNISDTNSQQIASRLVSLGINN